MSVQNSSFQPSFENGGYWEYYKDLERQFRNFLGYVPYVTGNECAYSFRLANLLVSIGSHIDSAFKEIAKYPEFAAKYSLPTTPSVGDYYDLAIEYQLPQRKVVFKRIPEREELTPFQRFEKVGNKVITPNWWAAYNKVKHKFSENFEQANLRNVRDALAGAFLLNVIHVPAALRLYDYGVLKTRMLGGEYEKPVMVMSTTREAVEDNLRKRSSSFPMDVTTPLFIYNYYQ